MIALQLLNKVLATQNDDILVENLLGVEYFTGYEKEYEFLVNHKDRYGNIPDTATFLSTFPDFELIEVTESDKYLVETIQEEHLYYQSIPVVQKIADLLKKDANAAAEYLIQQSKVLQPNYHIGGTDIIQSALERFDEYKDRRENSQKYFIQTGFKELDDIIRGLQRGEEFVVIIARTNQGKSWLLAAICAGIFKQDLKVGYLSPEMTASSVGYRIDTLLHGFSNKALSWGQGDDISEEYKAYAEELKTHKGKIIVATMNDFGKKVTVSKLRNFVKQYKLDALAIDGITYLSDERGNARDNKTTSLTNISEDLMELSVELGIPIITVVQANRSGVVDSDDEGTPELESIRDSDGIAHNASKVLAIRQKKNNVLEIGIKKQRNGRVGDSLNYVWSIDDGTFTYIPNPDSMPSSDRPKDKKPKGSAKDVF